MDLQLPRITLPHLQLRDYIMGLPRNHPDHYRILQIGAALEAEPFVLGSLRLGIHQEVIAGVLLSGLENRLPGYEGEYGSLFLRAGQAALTQLQRAGVFAHLPDLATQQSWIREDPNVGLFMILLRAQDHKFEDYHKLACMARDDNAKNIIDSVPLIGEFGMLVAEKLRTDELRAMKENIEYYSRLCNEHQHPPVYYNETQLPPAPYADYLLPAPGRRPAPPVVFLTQQPAAERPISSVPGPGSLPHNLTSTAEHGPVRSYWVSVGEVSGPANPPPSHQSHVAGGTQSTQKQVPTLSLDGYRQIIENNRRLRLESS